MRIAKRDAEMLALLPAAQWGFIGATLFFWSELEKILGLWLLWNMILDAQLGLGIAGSAVSIVASVCARDWRSFTSAVVSPLVILASLKLLPLIGVTPEWVRFQIAEPYYRWRVATSPRVPGEPRLLSFDWGERGGVAVWNVIDRLVYDESDEIGSGSSNRSEAWLNRSAGVLDEWVRDGRDSRVVRLGLHFYLVRMSW